MSLQARNHSGSPHDNTQQSEPNYVKNTTDKKVKSTENCFSNREFHP